MKDKKQPFTKKEFRAMQLLVKANKKFHKIEGRHIADVREWNSCILRCQRILMCRATERDYPDNFKRG